MRLRVFFSLVLCLCLGLLGIGPVGAASASTSAAGAVGLAAGPCSTAFTGILPAAPTERGRQAFYRRLYEETKEEHLDEVLRIRGPRGGPSVGELAKTDPVSGNKLEKYAAVTYYSKHAPTYGRDALLRLRALRPEWEELVKDPGLVLRLAEFEHFVARNATLYGKMTPPEVREEFSRHLGKRRVFRALSLTKEEAGHIVASGIDSDVIRKRTNLGRPYVWDHTLYRRVRRKGGEPDPLMSVSDHMDVAAAVATRVKETSPAPGKAVYVFELHVPEIDRLYMKPDSFTNSDLTGETRGTLGLVTRMGSQIRQHRPGERVESFLVGTVEPGEIRSAYRFDGAASYQFLRAER